MANKMTEELKIPLLSNQPTHLSESPHLSAEEALLSILKNINKIDTKLKGHSKKVTFVRILENNYIISASKDTKVKVWSVESKHCLGTFRGSHSKLNTLALGDYFLDHGELRSLDVLIGSEDGYVRRWRYHDVSKVSSFFAHSEGVLCMDYDRVKRTLVTGGKDGMIYMWDVDRSLCTGSLEGHSCQINSLKLYDGGKKLVSGSGDFTLKVWNMNEKALSFTSDAHDGEINTLDVSGDTIAAGCTGGSIYIWQGSCKTLHLKGNNSFDVSALRISKDAEFLIAAGTDNFVTVWNVERQAKELSLYIHEERVNCLDLSGDQSFIATASHDNTIGITWLKRSLEEITYNDHSDSITSISSGKQNSVLVTGSKDKKVIFWDLKKQTIKKHLAEHEGAITCTQVSSDGKFCITCSSEKSLKLWDLDSKTLINEQKLEWVPKSISISKTQNFFVLGFKAEKTEKKGNISIFKLENLEEIGKFTVNKSVNAVGITENRKGIIAVTSACSIHSIYDDTLTESEKIHTEKITSLQISEAKELLFTGSWDKSIKILNLSDFKVKSTLNCGSRVHCLSLSSGSKYLAAGQEDKKITVWNTSEQRQEFALALHSGPVKSVSFSFKNKFLISGSDDSTVKFWATHEKNRQRLFEKVHSRAITCVSSSPDGRVGVSASTDGNLEFWEIQTGSPINMNLAKPERTNKSMRFDRTEKGILSLQVAFDWKFVVTGSADKRIYVYFLNEKKVEVLKGHIGHVTCLALCDDNISLFSGSADGTVREWSIRDLAEKRSINVSSEGVASIAVSKNSRFLLAGDLRGRVKYYDSFDTAKVASFKGENSRIVSVLFSKNDASAIFANQQGKVYIWDLNTFDIVYSIVLHGQGVNCIVLSPCGKFLYSGSNDHSIKIWNIMDRYEEFVIQAHREAVTCLHINPVTSDLISGCKDESISICTSKNKYYEKHIQDHGQIHALTVSQNYIATGSSDFSVKLWNSRTFAEEKSLSGHEGIILSLVFSKDGKKIISGSRDSRIIVWNIETENVLAVLKGHSESVNSLIYLSDQKILSASSDKQINIWSIDNENPIGILTGHSARVSVLAYNEKYRYLASGSLDKCIKIWNIDHFKAVGTFAGHTLEVQCLSFTQTGSFLISGSNDKTLKIWDISTLSLKLSVEMKHPVLSLVITKDSRFVVSALSDNSLQILNLSENPQPIEIKRLDSSIKNTALSLNEEKIFIALDSAGLLVTDLKNRIKSAGFDTESFDNFIEDETKDLAPSSLTAFQNYLRFYNIFYCLKFKEYSKLSPSSFGVQVSKFNFTYTHFLCYFGQGKVLKELIKPGFALRPDKFAHSAFYYAIKRQDQESVDVLLNFVTSLSDCRNNSAFSTTFHAIQEDFQMIIRNSSQFLPEFLNSLLYERERSVYAQAKKALPITLFSNYQSLGKKNFPLKFLKHGKTSQTKTVEEKELVLYTSAVKVPYTNGTKDSLDLLKAIVDCDNDRIYKAGFIKYYVEYKFYELRWLAYGLAVVLIGNVGISLMIVEYGSLNLPVLLLFIASNAVLLTWELVQMVGGKTEYFTNPMNLLDFTRVGFSAIWVALDMLGWRIMPVTWLMVLVNLFRGFSALRVFEGTRHYLKLIQKAVKNILWFLLVFFSCVISFGLMLIISENHSYSFSSILASPLAVTLGVNNLEAEEISLAYISFLLFSVINVLVLTNVLIAILSDTYDEFLTKREVIDRKEKVDLLLEIEEIYYSFIQKSNSMKYLQVCDKASRLADDKWKGRILHLEKVIKSFSGQPFDKNALVELEKKLEQSIEKSNKGMEKIMNKVVRIARRVEKGSGGGGQFFEDDYEKLAKMTRESVNVALAEHVSGVPAEFIDSIQEMNSRMSAHSDSVNLVKNDLNKIKKSYESNRKESENFTKLIEEQLVKTRRKIDESIRTKIEEKMSELETSIQNKINTSISVIEKKFTDAVQDSELNVKEHIDQLRESIV